VCSENPKDKGIILNALILTADLLLFKTLADKKTWARPQYYDRYATQLSFLNKTFDIVRWQNSVVTGDEKTAVENLRRFFEQHFHESNDS